MIFSATASAVYGYADIAIMFAKIRRDVEYLDSNREICELRARYLLRGILLLQSMHVAILTRT